MERFSAPSVTFKTRSKRSLGYPHSRIADKYGMRPRTIIRRLLQERRLREASHKDVRSKLHPFPKYHKKLASFRERSHVREINKAFENLRNALPTAAGCRNDASAAAKMTTLRLALRYIAALTQLLQEDDIQRSYNNDDDKTSSCSETDSDDHKTYLTGQEDLKPQPSSQKEQDDAEDTYILALAKIFEESDDSNDTSASDSNEKGQTFPAESDDRQSSREDFSDLSDHDVEGQLDALASLGSLTEETTDPAFLS
ncbi:helix-loop-helix protein delilah [Cherax quadricarinatus]|uniref:helix-loop-helix protein delilah n=1 Tax=Cherax quadricarinatus TaxID=27406 RepID=UPI00387E79E1